MININDIKINQKVWFKEHWTERIVCGFVSEIAKRSDNEDYIIMDISCTVSTKTSQKLSISLPAAGNLNAGMKGRKQYDK